jgi:hypothetical protein
MQASERVPLGFETAAAVRSMVGFAVLTAALRVHLDALEKLIRLAG